MSKIVNIIITLTPFTQFIKTFGFFTLYVLSFPVENFYLINSMLSLQDIFGYLLANQLISYAKLIFDFFGVIFIINFINIF